MSNILAFQSILFHLQKKKSLRNPMKLLKIQILWKIIPELKILLKIFDSFGKLLFYLSYKFSHNNKV